MPKFKFRLQSYFDIKVKLEDKARQDYGMAMVQLDAELREHARLEAERGAKIAHFRESLESSVKPSEVRSFNNYIELLKKNISAANERVNTAREAAETRRAELVEAMKQRKMLEKLHDNARIDFNKEQTRAEQRATDEVVSYKFNNMP
ncbi:MAG: flagellar export protein FliJ [Defluviitaleaceae bacterium]|nr:flagellar export protein FliJ [Defluviitaleaceae bacterium]